MHTAEEVRARAERIRGLMGQYELRQMILSYAALLEAMEEQIGTNTFHETAVMWLRQRAAEKQKARKG